VKRKGPKLPVILVFGEDDNDRMALRELMLALRNDLPKIETRRKPTILVKDLAAAKRRAAQQTLDAQVRADAVRFDVRLVVLHEDCDALEPAHEQRSKNIEDSLKRSGLPALAATPAWEMEAWWFLWPDAPLKVVSRWRRPVPKNARVGLIRNVKEELRRALRPPGKDRPRDYRESDAPQIAAAIRELGVIRSPEYESRSFEHFRDKFLGAWL
jgi:hypothetical protein